MMQWLRHARNQGCSNRELRESRGAKKRQFAPNREALNRIPNRQNCYLMTPAVQWELKVVAQKYLENRPAPGEPKGSDAPLPSELSEEARVNRRAV